MVFSDRFGLSVVGEGRFSPQSPSSAGRSAGAAQDVPAGAALSAEIWISQAKTLLGKCVQNLKGSLNSGYPFRDLYPIEQQKWERDRALLELLEALLARAPQSHQAPEPNPAQGQGAPMS
jgi:hypothetical protein